MRSILFLAVLTLSGPYLLAQQAGNTLSGTVVDSAGTPLAGVSVFLNNTSRGTATGAKGDFKLEIPRGTYELIFSAIGYSTRVIDVNGAHLPPPLLLFMRPKATELAAVTVEPYDKHGWARWGKFFIENFIGATENAADCKLKNHDVLRFYYSRRSNRLSVTATEPLKIDNNALGYTLTFQLEGFKADFSNKYVQSFGYPYFQPMTPKNADREKYWAFKRKQAYTGSILQFMRSLYAGQSITEGFLIEKDVTGPNAEKRRVKAIYDPDFQKPGSFSMDTLHYFWDVLRQPDIITWRAVVPPDSILTVAPDGSRELYFDTPLIVLFGVRQAAANGAEFRESGLRLLAPRPIKLEENGNYYPAQEVLSTGYWGQTQKICNLLPLDYQSAPAF